MKIEKIEILINVKGTDQITLRTDLPNTFPMVPDQGNMMMNIDLQHGTAIEYARKHFFNDNFPACAVLIDGKTGKKEIISLNPYYYMKE